jgi:glycosyltransferase involved in cell wall biosynthesis
LISVVIPAYNAHDKIAGSLGSILAQDYDSIEIIFVDDASTDATADGASDILSKYRRQYKIIRHDKNMGVSAARNTGFSAAAGDYVLFMDADDLADADFISTLRDAITKDDSDVAFCSFRDRFDSTGREDLVEVQLDASRPTRRRILP